ncbi:MAG: hypothetical protein D6683_06565, partial [Actinomyces sp.]
MSRRLLAVSVAVVLVALGATACSGSNDDRAGADRDAAGQGAADEGGTVSEDTGSDGPAIPTTTAPTVPGRGTVDEGLRPFIDEARADLADRLGIDADTIVVRTAVLVVWPDASLGCPDPKQEYAQVPTDGSIIELEAQGRTWRYHTGGRQGPFLCERPLLRTPATSDAD